MPSQRGTEPEKNPENATAIEHVSGAHDLLQALRKKVGQHPELEEAIVKLETALSILTVQTGGLL